MFSALFYKVMQSFTFRNCRNVLDGVIMNENLKWMYAGNYMQHYNTVNSTVGGMLTKTALIYKIWLVLNFHFNFWWALQLTLIGSILMWLYWSAFEASCNRRSQTKIHEKNKTISRTHIFQQRCTTVRNSFYNFYKLQRQQREDRYKWDWW